MHARLGKNLAPESDSDTMRGLRLTAPSLKPPTRRLAATISCFGAGGRIVAALLLCWGMALAGPKAVLKEGQAKLEGDLIKVTVPVLRQQAAALAVLEKKAVAARDYATAMKAREERLKVETDIAAQEKVALLLAARQGGDAADAPERIVFKPADATLDRVRYDATAGVLTDWSAVGASVSWKLPGLPAGGYEVVLRYTSGALEGGTVIVQEAFYTLTADLQTTLKGSIEHNLGTLKIRDGSGVFKISAKSMLKSNLMKLESVELIPSNR